MTASQSTPEIWVFDSNYRVYEDDAGNRTMSPNYRKQWRKCEVVGETSRSWIVRHYGELKVPKNRALITSGWVAFSEAEVDDMVFKHDHGYKIAEAVRSVNASTLRKVAELIGYKS